MLSRAVPPPGITPGRAGMNQQDLLAADLKLADLEGVLVLESLDENVRQLDDARVVEHVAEPVCRQGNLSRQDAVLGVHDDIDETGRRRRLRWRRVERAASAADATRSADNAGEPLKHARHAERQVCSRMGGRPERGGSTPDVALGPLWGSRLRTGPDHNRCSNPKSLGQSP